MCRKVYVIFALLLWPITSSAMNFSQCFADIKNCASSSNNCTLNISNTTAFSLLLTSQGHRATSTGAASALSYASCRQYCEPAQGQFIWTFFARDYAAWLLPYLALVSQLPFGAPRRMDNLMSAVLTLGSPTLAGYSLYMTLLNARWVNDQLFSGIDYPNATVRRSVVWVLCNLQQVPLRVHPGESARFESLVVHPDNDSWWNTLAEELDFSHKWSVASAISIALVVVAYLLSVAISIAGIPDYIGTFSQATGSGLLWLLPIVVGWLVISPRCDYYRVQSAYRKANRQVFVADSDDPIATPTHVSSNFGLTIDPDPDPLHGESVSSPDEARIPPIFNYARIFVWYQNAYLTSLFYRAAWRKSNNHIGVDGQSIPGYVHSDVPRAGRLGTRKQTIDYCQPDNREYAETRVLWPRGLFSNMIVASLMSLQLQWGTTSAAILAVWSTPSVGLGCRALAYLIYGFISTTVWVLLVLSSVLGYYAHHLLNDQPRLDIGRSRQPTPGIPSPNGLCVSPGQNHLAVPLLEIPTPTNDRREREGVLPNTTTNARALDKPPQARRIYGQVILQVAHSLRWIGKLLATINAISVITNSIFQYAGMYSSCYCDSKVLTRGAFAFVIINPTANDIDFARKVWIGGLSLSLISCSVFVASIYLVRDSLPVPPTSNRN